MQDFNGKVAVITGGASGIGLAVAQALAAQGARLVLADIEAATLLATVASLRAAGAEVEGLVTDVGDRAAVERLADLAYERFGAAHIVMNNAGIAVIGPVQDMTAQDWEWSMRVNLWGPIHGVNVFLPRMLAGGEEGHMLFTASFAGLVPNLDSSTYNVTKAGVVALAESVAKDLRKTKIGASVLCPMRVTSNIDASARNRPAELGGQAAEKTYSDDELSSLQGRTLTAEETADLVLAGIRENRLYLHTHKEAEGYVRARADRILSGFAFAH